MSRLHYDNSIAYEIAAMKHKGAVSVRRIRGPNPAAIIPASFILAISFSVNPPSGPKTARTESPGLRALN